MEKVYQLLNSSILLGDDEVESLLYVYWDNNKVFYITTDKDGSNHMYYESIKHPEELNDEERNRVLSYCLAQHDIDEIVNYNDFFLQGDFITESNIPTQYRLTDEWLNQ